MLHSVGYSGDPDGFLEILLRRPALIAYMSISVRVMTAQALAQMKMLEKELAGVNSQMVKSGAASAVFSSGMTRSTSSLTKFGNQLQWTGRQLSYNFSLPLAAAGAAAMKFALDNEAGMTRVAKVYGDSSIESAALKKELVLLEKAFVSLSSHYGVQQKEVLEIAAAWASAGASGIVLAKGVETTLKTMVLGEMSAVEATQALISVQAQYNLSSDELINTMAMLNKVENETAVTTKDLIAGLSRSAGVARTAGIDVNHLAAMMASLVPAAGSAAEAGNGLKAIMTRMLAPTGEAAMYLNDLGLKVDTLGWKSKNGTERLELFAQAFHGLADSQKMVIAKSLGSQYQINKLGVLLEDINKSFDKNTRGQSRYGKALDVTSDEVANLKQAEKELNTVLDSNPQKLKIIWTSLQNGMANAIQPLIPYLLYAANAIRSMFEWFTNLPPAVKKFVTIMLVALALFGPLIRYIGSTITLLSELRWFLLGTASGLMKLAMFPFVKISGGIKSILAVMRGGPVVAAAWSSAMAILSGIFGAALTGMKVMTVAFFAGLKTLFIAGQASLLASTAGFRVLMAARWAAVLAAVKAVTVSFGPIMTVIWVGMMNMLRVATAAGGRAINVAMVAILNGMMAIAAAGARAITFIWESMIIAWQVVMSSGRVVMMAAMSAMTAVVAVGSTAMLGVWRTAVLAMTLILATGRPLLVTAMATTMGAVRNVVAVGGAAIAAAWRWITAAVAMAVTMGQAAIYRAWATVTAGVQALWATMPAFFAVVNRTIRTVMLVGATMAANAFRLGLAAGMLKIKAIIPAIVGMFKTMGIAIQAALTGPIGWAIGAAILLLVMFSKQIGQIIDNTIAYFQNLPEGVVNAFQPLARVWQSVVEFAAKMFHKLPESVQNAMMSVVRVVESAAMQVYELFSYLNPFARHSPSLVESVTAGMAEVNKQFGTLSNISGPIKKAHADIEAFAQATLKLRQGMDSMERAQDRANLAKLAPGALDEFDTLVSDITSLTARLNAMTPIVKAQEAAVASWKTKLDAANAALDTQKSKLDALKDVASKATEALNASKEELERFASAPIQGMKDMNDAIFENDMAQKKLRLEMLKMGEGEGIDKARDKLSKLAGEIELLNGEQTRLRSGGAGSEITGVYDEQIKELEKQQKSTQDTLSEYDKLSGALDKLQRQSEMLDLEKSLKFDPLLKKISETAHAVKELPFDEIINGIGKSNKEIEEYTKQVDLANEAVRRQQAIVDEATKARDAISARYDAENAKLTKMKDAYDAVKGAIDDANRALSDLNQTASKTLTAGKKGANGLSGPGANFADVGGKGALGREGDAAFNEKALEQFAQDQAKKTSDLLGQFDMFGGIKKKWNEFTAWMGKNAGPMWQGVVDSSKAIFGGVDFSGFTGKVSGFWDKITAIWNKAVEIVGKIWALFRDDIKAIWDTIWSAIAPAWKKIQPSLAQFGELLGPLGELMGKIWARVKPLVAIIAGGLLLALKIIASVIKNTVGPILNFLVDTFKFLLDTIFNTIKFITAIFNGDWKAAWEAFKSIQKAALDWMLSLFVNLGKLLWGAVKGIVEGIFGFWEWLYDELIGHSIIPDMINAIVDWFKSLPGKVWTALQSLGTKIVQAVKAAWAWWVSTNIAMWTGIYNWFLGLAVKVYNAVITIRSKLAEVATAAWAAFKSRSQAAWNAIVAWVSGLWKDFTTGLSILKTKLVEVGKNIMQGLVDGLEAGWEWVKAKVEAVAELIPDSIKKVLGIASPAKKTDVLGQQTMQGYGNGIVKKIPDLQKAATDAASAVTNAMPSTISSNVGITAQADATGFAQAFAVPAQGFFEVMMPELWKLLLKQSLESWMQVEKNFTDKYVFFVNEFFEKTLPELWKILTAQAVAMWIAILASFNSKIKAPLTTFFTMTIKSQWASMVSTAATMWSTIYSSFKTSLGDPVVMFFKETIPGAIKNAFAGIGTVFKGAFSTAAATAAAAVNKVIAAVNRGIDAMNAVIPEVKFDIKKVATIALAAGGAVNGPGTGTSDSINAKLSRGEHVWTAREVAAAGGHGAVESMRKAVMGFAKGGAVGDINATHAVGGKAGLIAFGHFLTKRGFDVTEGPAPFGPISYGGHSKTSLHYSGNAIDVNKGSGTSAREQAAIDGIVKYAKEYGLRTLWRVKDHFNHAHFDTGRGDQVGGGGGGGIVDYIAEGKAALDKVVKEQGARIGGTADYMGQIGAGAFKAMGESVKSQAASIWQNFSPTGENDSRQVRGGMGSAEVARIAEAKARSMGATNKQLLALIETGLVESGMRNLNYGDRDSLGFLQQRPSMGWGTPAQVMDVAHATMKFMKKAQRVDGNGLSAGQLAQKVQVSAFPDRYAQRRADAMAILNKEAPGIPTSVYDRGGWLDSGSAAINKSGKRELVLTPQQSAILMSLGGPNSLPGLARLSGLAARSEARANQLTGTPTTIVYEGSTQTTEIHIHGNLEFPNVKNGADASGFVRQLGILAGGQ